MVAIASSGRSLGMGVRLEGGERRNARGSETHEVGVGRGRKNNAPERRDTHTHAQTHLGGRPPGHYPHSNLHLPPPVPSSAGRHPRHRVQGLRGPDTPGAAAPAQWRRWPGCPHGRGAGFESLEGTAGARRTSHRSVGRKAAISMGPGPAPRWRGRWMGCSGGYLEEEGRNVWGTFGEGSHCLPGPKGS